MNDTMNRYKTFPMAFHWLTLLLLVAVYACIELREFFPKGSDPRNALKSWHFMLGLTVFGLTGLRLISRWLNPPPMETNRTDWQRLLSGVTHFALYVLLLAMPLLGWSILSAEGKEILWFGLELPALIAPDEASAELLEEVHGTIGTAGYFLIGLHALAALFHHYVKQDNTLLRMLPTRS